jgi:DNA-binding XRE family transcriptional regulator
VGRTIEVTDRTIYFVECSETKRIKIGRTKNLAKRLNALQTASPGQLRALASFEGPGRAETVLHDRFRHHNRGGEWFHPGEDLLEFIQQEDWKGMNFDPQPAPFTHQPFISDGLQGMRLRTARMAGGLTQAESAQRMLNSKATAQYWSDVENGRRVPSLEWLWGAAQALGVNPHTLDERLASKRWPKPEKG